MLMVEVVYCEFVGFFMCAVVKVLQWYGRGEEGGRKIMDGLGKGTFRILGGVRN
jgi:hypothetical protein